jgi:chromosome segregation ATPase
MDETALRALYTTVESAITERQIIPAAHCDVCAQKDETITTLEGEKTELNDTVTAIRQELELANQDKEILIEQRLDSHTSYKELLREHLASMRKLNGEEAPIAEIRDSMADESLSDLKKTHNELRGKIDFDNMKLGLSDSPNLPEQVVDPTINVDDGYTPDSKYEKWIPTVKKRYNELLIDGKAVAEHYLMEMKRGKFVPADFAITNESNDN